MRNKSGLSTLEYAVLVVAVAVAVAAVQLYVRRAISGRFKESVDSFGQGRLYDIQPAGH